MALGAEKITEEPLQGSNATSLAELLLNPHAQGPYGAATPIVLTVT
jgi:hypothetical protein